MPTRPVGGRAVMAEQCTALSPRSVVAAASPTAAHIGAAMLDSGGNAYDAAVAAALAETVLLPPKCGLAGDLIALVWEHDRPAPQALLAIGGAPAGLAGAIESGGFGDTGPLSVGVPGAPAGYAALAERGRLGLATCTRPAIDLAEDGFCWATVCTVLAEESADLVRAHQPEGTVYYPGGSPIAPGAVVRLPGLARALRQFADDGAGLLDGSVGDAIVDRVQRAGGVLRRSDYQFAAADWTVAAQDERLGSLWATPAPTHGPSLLDALADLGTRPSPADVLAAVRASIARRGSSLADPSGTSMVSAVDASGTIVVVVHSNSYPRFGSGLIVEEYDLILANRAGRGFDPRPGHPNHPAPGRRPATTLHAWAWEPSPGRRLLGATPGGANQMPWNAQSLARLVSGDDVTPRRLADAVVAPRWQLDADGTISIESGFSRDEIAAFRQTDPGARVLDTWELRSAMQIVGDLGDVSVAVADPRTVGAAVPG